MKTKSLTWNRCGSSFAIIAFLLAIFITANAQSVTDGSTPLALSPGAPAGSYALSDFDNVNLYNGNLDFTLPLVKIAGRGSAGYMVAARIEQKWIVDKEFRGTQGNLYTPNPNWWSFEGFEPIYTLGTLSARQGGSVSFHAVSGGCYVHNQTLTRLTFTTPDGTEYELRDQATNGQPATPTTCSGFNRGRVFVTSDGNSAIFTSDADILDWYDANEPAPNFGPSGDLAMRDGSYYRIDGGAVSWMRDRNGNRVTITTTYNPRQTTITDSLNRQVTITYATTTVAYDLFTLKGFGGATRTLKVYQSTLQNCLRSDFSIQNMSQLFPELNGAYAVPNNPGVISAVELPNGQQYHFYYNSYGELARVVLPTGGAIEYDYAAGLTDGAASGVMPIYNGDKHVYRRVIERRIYPDGGSGIGYASRMSYSRPETTTSNAGYVDTDQYNPSGTLLTRSRHYFYGSPRDSFKQQATEYSGWEDGREYETIEYAADGTTQLRQVTHTFAQRAAVGWWTGSSSQEPPNDPRLIETDTTLVDSNQVSKQTVGYDDSVPFNNQNNVKEYDFGSGSAGSLVRETRATFVTSSSYTDLGLFSLPSQVSVYDGNGVERARTSFEYDNYTPDSNHAGLVNRSNISGFDASFDTSYGRRGNPTATTRYLLSSGSVTGSVTTYAQFDIAGNAVKAIDGRGNASTVDYRDNFGAPGDTVESSGNPSNSAPTELGSSSAFALPFAVTNTLGQTTYAKFDYYLGRPVTVEDLNAILSRGYYDDALDRPTQVIRAVNGGTDAKSQTTFAYDDTNHVITTTSDQSTYGDNVLKSSVLYDPMGRTIEKRQYEGATNYIAVQLQYDALGRAYKTSNPFRPWQSETAIWTTSAFDALGRVTSVTTPDSAAVSTSYSGNSVTVTDQAGKARKSVKDGLGRLIQVYEDPAGLNYRTSYSYDTLDNLTTVNQDSQTRGFVYDSLKRLTSATNPESGTANYDYDANGNVLHKIDARSVTTTNTYDAFNRVTSNSYSDGTGTVTYAYDPAIANGRGRLSSVSSSVASYSYGNYDALGRVKSVTQTIYGITSQTYSLNFGYDLAGHATLMTYPSGHTVTYNYDGAGRLADKDSQNLAFTGNLGDGTTRTYSRGINYTPRGAMSQEQFGTTTAVYNKLLYNVRGQLAEIRESTTGGDTSWNRGAIINHYSNNYGCWGASCNAPDNNGNLMKQDVYIPANDQVSSYTMWWQQYSYDSLNRLTQVYEHTSADWQQSYSYDRYGNRTIDYNNTSGNIPRPQFSVDISTNRLGVPSGYSGTMHFDAAGNLDVDTYSGSAVARGYDAENRMTSETTYSSVVTGSYSYDGNGRRVKRKVGGVETWQVYGISGELLAEYAAGTPASTPQKEHGYRNGQLLVTLTSPLPGGAPSFSDNPIQVGVTAVQAAHITELRAAINGLRAHLGLAAYSWTKPTSTGGVVATGGLVTADPIIEMRTALDQALGAPPVAYASGLAQGQPIKAVHIQELRERLAAASGSDVRWLVSDQHGTARMIFDQSGSLAAMIRHDYLPFGEELWTGAGARTTAQGYGATDGIREKFTGKERDGETGLDFFGARYYAVSEGRFTSVDPLRASVNAGNPQTWNRYSYVTNRPTIAVDPDGLSIIVVVVNPRSAGGNGNASIRLDDRNGREVREVAGIAKGQGSDRTKTNQDTPFGVYRPVPNDPHGANANGTQGGTSGQAARKDNSRFGTGIIYMAGVSGEIATSGRSTIYIHGGPALDDHQTLENTYGCVRTENANINALISDIGNLASTGDPLTNIFIGDATTLNAIADERDANGSYKYPELRHAFGLDNPNPGEEDEEDADRSKYDEDEKEEVIDGAMDDS